MSKKESPPPPRDKIATDQMLSKSVVRAKQIPLSEQTEGGFPIVGIGASAGGLEAFESFFNGMAKDSGIAFVLVAHLDRTHVSLLPELLQKKTTMPVTQIKDGTLVRPNNVYVIPPNKDLTILRGTLYLMELIRARGANLPIDSFFGSLAADQKANAIGIILSGTGTDGSLGLKAIKSEFGLVMVQDEKSAKYDGMPRSAIATRQVDFILPVEEMPAQLINYTQHVNYSAKPRIVPTNKGVPDALQKIFVILRSRTEHDFSLYKKNTICRRIERRMNLHQIEDILNYVRYLRDSESEVDILFKELLIGVTNFFRDPAAFSTLKETILPELLAKKPPDSIVRVWLPGCSSGEEAYSIAILLRECMDDRRVPSNVQIFATDIDQEAIAAGRAGIYPQTILADVGAKRLKRHFDKEKDGQYRINKSIREMLVFANQNIIKHPPFTKIDLLCCRNLLIYLDPELQKKLLPLFHYSLNPNGILFLGSSENIGQNTDLFSIENKKWKIYRRKKTSITQRPMLDLPSLSGISEYSDESEGPKKIERTEELSAAQFAEAILYETHAPPCAIIDDSRDVLYIHGRTGRFLEPAEGKASSNILEMARPGVKLELNNAILKATNLKAEVICNNLRVVNNGGYIHLDMTVKPVLGHSAQDLLMVIFQEIRDKQEIEKTRVKTSKTSDTTVAQLELELQHNQENLQTTIEELETSNEELKSTNEELQSTNEELQSTNEEMETAKEELQSLNEESSTVNAELQSRIDELSEANDVLKNLMDSTDIATVFLDLAMCIRRFTPAATNIIPLTGTDTGRPIQHFASRLVDVDMSQSAEQVLDNLAVKEVQVSSNDGQTYNMRMRPYRTVSNVIDGVVITFENITALKKFEKTLQKTEAKYRTLQDNSPYCIHEIDLDGRIVAMNPAGLSMMNIKTEDKVIGIPYLDIVSTGDKGRIKELLSKAMDGQSCEFESIKGIRFQSSLVRVDATEDSVASLLGITQYISESKDK